MPPPPAPKAVVVPDTRTIFKRAWEAAFLGIFTLVFTAVAFDAPGPVAGWPLWRQLLAFGPPALIALTVALVPRRAKFVVGADGLRFEKLFGSRFVPYAEITEVGIRTPRVQSGAAMRDPAGWDVCLRSGETIFVRDWTESADTLRRVRDLIEEARRASIGSGFAPAALARDGRDVARWRVDLARAASAPVDFRSAPLSRDVLVSTLDDGAAPLEQRVGAAIALRSVDAGARDRIRIVAESSADESAREALGLLAEEEEASDAELEAVLERVAHTDS